LPAGALVFDATLRQHAAARESSQEGARGEGLDDAFRLKFKSAAPAPPRTGNSPFTSSSMGSMRPSSGYGRWPIGRRPGWPARPSVCSRTATRSRRCPRALRLAIEDDPKAATYQVWLGQALAVTGDRAGALAAFRKAAGLFPGDKSVGNAREAYKYRIEKGLRDLGSPEPPPKER
jgi:hypothetical protein